MRDSGITDQVSVIQQNKDYKKAQLAKQKMAKETGSMMDSLTHPRQQAISILEMSMTQLWRWMQKGNEVN
jgi:hypothetical protein